ncbi:RagB/SusD family nutrient uptake outer membrane protein [Sphingobacterium sp. UT-1RO-CII-1]|uniref:RagB/SusD family nutrient uptake outer membrane protein n=1 Tax=Sphingobacterium sp. UT-1RO-CII-1 TaxID=2995225 RepID=UPI00227CC376|nr:RagB/SusD family nutrient uptake outer membrane protein [Sphingobacterium sp. UT-1RO-CII-1]MCY4781043.1 RagB/SusD family nutrient uptake outer membrane protein [Sphingobacterium sp. UT-1RO-CII-1]
MKIFRNSKLRIFSTAVTVVTLSLTSCSKDALQLDPVSRVAPSTVFATTQNAYAAINGMHKYLYSQWHDNQAAGGQSGNMLYMEVLGEDFVMTAQANGWFINEYKWLNHRNAESNINLFNYAFYYAMIGNANAIIANIDGAVGPDEDKNFLKAQALTYRAWSYYQMVQLYGKRYVKGGDNGSLGVPIIKEASLEAKPRNTVEEVYAQVNQDLDEAIILFGSAKSRPDKSHLNVNVAKGVKARVALTQQNYEVAATNAREAKQGFTLMNPEQYIDGFVSFSNPEWMWGINHRDDQPTYFYSFYAYIGNFSSTNTRGNPKAINSLLYAKISDTDIRKQLWDPTGADNTFPLAASGVRMPYMTRKFTMPNPNNSNGDLAFMRAAEMFLIEAEALANLTGREVDARKALFDLVITRDPDYTLSTKSGAPLIEEILTHRRVELWGEGFRFYDLKRLNMPLNREGANHIASLAGVLTVPAGDKRWEFLIPQGELNRTLDVVKQNPI